MSVSQQIYNRRTDLENVYDDRDLPGFTDDCPPEDSFPVDAELGMNIGWSDPDPADDGGI